MKPSGENAYTVSQVNARVERLLGDDPVLADVAVEGEVSNCKYNQSGHIYFTLKDSLSALSCVMFAGKRRTGLRFSMKDGDKVVVRGYVGVYATAGRYQLYAESIELSGVGSLYQRFEELKRKLAAEGLFAPEHKHPLPFYAMRIGIVTAPTGAAVRDIIRVSRLRNPYVQLILYPAVVQGDAAVASVVQGISTLDVMGLDIIIVGRGGGSIEDLWAFNEESVARAIFAAQTPVITAVGHETDVTIADFVADVRAATPSQAAELATFVYVDFHRNLVRYCDRLERSMDHRLSLAHRSVENCRSRLLAMRPDKRLLVQMEKIGMLRQRLEVLMLSKLERSQGRLTTAAGRLEPLMLARLERCRSRLLAVAGRLEGLSPAKRLAGGFAHVSTPQGKTVTSVQQLTPGDTLLVRLKDGTAETTVTHIDSQNL